MNDAEVTWQIGKEIDDVQLFLGNSDGKKQIVALNADVTIPGTGITPEILRLQAAVQELTEMVEDLEAERLSILQTGVITGSILPPATTLQEYQQEQQGIFSSVEQEIETLLQSPPLTVIEADETGQALNEQLRIFSAAASDLEGRLPYAPNKEGIIFRSLSAAMKDTAWSLRGYIAQYQEYLRDLWAPGNATISSVLRQALQGMKDAGSELRLYADAPDVQSFTELPGTLREKQASTQLHGTAGSLIFSALQGEDQYRPELTTSNQDELISKGETSMIDFAESGGRVVRAEIEIASGQLAESAMIIQFLRGPDVLNEQSVLSSGSVHYENAGGITGILIKNAQDLMTPEGRELFEYRSAYQPRYQNNDPGADYFFFLEERPEWYNDRHAIIAEADKRDVPVDAIISRVDVVMNMDEAQTAAVMTNQSNAAFASASADRINSVPLPNDYWAVPFPYFENEYNAISLKRYSSGPWIEYIGYQHTNSGEFIPLPEEFYTRIGDTWIIHPTGRPLHLALVGQGGQPYRPYLDPGEIYDYEILNAHALELQNTLPENGSVIDVEHVKLFGINSNKPLGWREGAWMETESESPVAIGWLKAEARITNSGAETLNFTVRTYSGFAGTPNWDTIQGEYQGSLAPGDSRILTDDIYMYADANGGSCARIVVFDDQGRIVAEYVRTVDAPEMPASEIEARLARFTDDWALALAQAQADTIAYLNSIGKPIPSMADPQMIIAQMNLQDIPDPPDIHERERLMRIASRILQAAIARGDTAMIASAEALFIAETNAYILAQSQLWATPSLALGQTMEDVLEGTAHSPGEILVANLHANIGSLFNGSMNIQGLLSGEQTLQFGDNIQRLLEQHGAEIFSFGEQYFAEKGRTAQELAQSFEWIMTHGEGMTALTAESHPIDAAKKMLRAFADNLLSIPSVHAADPISLVTMSDDITSSQAVIDSLAQMDIQMNTQSLAGRMYVWAVKQLELTTDFGDTVDIAKSLEAITDIPYWKYLERVWAKRTFERMTPEVTRHSLRKLMRLGQYSQTFSNPNDTTVGISESATDKYPGSSPDDPERETYRTFTFIKSDGGEIVADRFVRVRFDVILQEGKTSYDHADFYLYDRNGNELLDQSGQPIEIKLTSESVAGTLFVDIPLSVLTKHITLDPQMSGGPGYVQGGFTIKSVVWFEPENVPGYGKHTQMFEVADLEVPRADLSHLPETDLDILSEIRMPVGGTGWQYTIDSGFHRNEGLYALDLTAGTDTNNREIFSPGEARVSWIDIKDGSVWLEIGTSSGKVVRVAIHHMDHMFEAQTGIAYEGLGEAMKRLGYFEQYEAELEANGITMTKDIATYLMNKYPEVQAALQPVLDQIAYVQSVVDGLRTRAPSQYNPRGGLWLEDMELFAQGGNEGYSTGAHIHIDVSHDGRGIPLFGLIDAYFQGIQAKNIDFISPSDGNVMQHLTMTYDRELNTLTNRDEGIAMNRVQHGNTALNEAYAIEENDISHKIVWAFNATTDTYMWLQVDEFNNLIHPSEGKVWQWINGEWILTDYQ